MVINFEDFEPYFFLNSDGEEETVPGEYFGMLEECRKKGSRLVTVVDSECETVCFAPVNIARKIVELLNKEK